MVRHGIHTVAGDFAGGGALGAVFDLVFVLAIGQLSGHLLHDLSWVGAAQTLVLLLATFTVWVHTAFEATFFDISRRGTQLSVLTATGVGLFMNAGIGTAFTTHSGNPDPTGGAPTAADA